MLFISLLLANTWEKNRGSPCLFPHKLLWKVDMVLRSQSGWIICAAGTGARNKITPTVFDVCTRDQACFRLLLCVWYRQHINKKLEKITLNTEEWGKSRFDESLELWIFILDHFVAPEFCLIPVSWGSIFLLLHNNFRQRTWRKDYWFLFFICSLVWFLYTAKCEFSSRPRVYWSPSCGSGDTVCLICSRNIRLSTLGVWTTYEQ